MSGSAGALEASEDGASAHTAAKGRGQLRRRRASDDHKGIALDSKSVVT